MHFAIAIALALFASNYYAQGAPTALDAATLLKNGQEAQKLNTEFKTLKATDSCQGMSLL